MLIQYFVGKNLPRMAKRKVVGPKFTEGWITSLEINEGLLERLSLTNWVGKEGPELAKRGSKEKLGLDTLLRQIWNPQKREFLGKLGPRKKGFSR